MGAIAEAAANNPQALELFRRILLASAAIPSEFPRVMFDVDVLIFPRESRRPRGRRLISGDDAGEQRLVPVKTAASIH